MISEEAKSKLAERMGESTSSIRTREPEWVRLMREGVIVQLHIRRWRAENKLSLEDLGIEIEGEEERKFWDEFLSLGQKRLLPSQYIRALASIDSAARASLGNHGFATYWGRFVPATAYAEWKKRNLEYQARYFAIATEIDERYDELVNQTISAYAAGARGAYARLAKLGARPKVSEDEFVRRFTRQIADLIPSRRQVRESFGFEVEISYIPLPSMLAEDEAQAERVRAQRQREAEEEEMSSNARWAEVKVQNQALAERERMLAEMNADIVRNLRAQKQAQVDKFLEGVVAQLRGQVYEVVLTALESIRRNDGRLVGKSVQQLQNLIQTVGSLNFFDDKELTLKLGQVEAALGPSKGYADVTGSLRELGLLCRATLIDLGEKPRSGRDLGIADEVPVADIRRQRRDLGLDPNVSVLDVVRGTRGWDARTV